MALSVAIRILGELNYDKRKLPMQKKAVPDTETVKPVGVITQYLSAKDRYTAREKSLFANSVMVTSSLFLI